ncbi:MAG: hypothetical protein A2915_00160 [Candidatus Yanofskybacteria bacterium RIFCSPLOWO2_01_FULL_41_34]|uniref:Uncharacterized protein n=1 Tax=Candidatus Yanofskybacteria bacterium RIFCSPHIGHO2_01_FULL_41_26 TaxID=1802661 RepID=A0A1F8EE75_9BACT|nr:MAG: hypothetical protein A2649_02090 [Candidatus Yanofskybacteria bacterium RIFCSPHIGHO2_01_FULL_41_26]OGN21236.1 MAG: hypothetical protein A2915_00160 [Candidatus Yanofskybacteria bacterium RIFCSPLOWO2_01_FULL_41_34]
MSEISHPVFSYYDQELVCECGHPRKYHNDMGLSENLIVGTNCNACRCREFKQSIENPQNEIIRLRKEIEVRKKKAESVVIEIDNELNQLRKKCEHPNQKSQQEHDFTAYWCDDCGKNWSR